MGKLDWSGICATSTGRHQCCKENCILFDLCLIKDASELTPKAKGCGVLLFNHPEFQELKCKCGDSCGYYCDKCSQNTSKEKNK